MSVVQRFPRFSVENATNQKFSLPNTIIYYIIKNYDKYSAQLFYSLYFTCKWFYPRLKIYPCVAVDMKSSTQVTFYEHRRAKVVPIEILDNLDVQFYFCHQMSVCPNMGPNYLMPLMSPRGTSRLLKYAYKLDLCNLNLYCQILTTNEFKMLISNESEIQIKLKCVIVIHSDGSIASFDEILSYVPMATSFTW